VEGVPELREAFNKKEVEELILKNGRSQSRKEGPLMRMGHHGKRIRFYHLHENITPKEERTQKGKKT